MSTPKVFISYSHDSTDHKKWVYDLAVKMRNNGVDAILDQWELKPGDDLPHFMETHLASADKIIMVCTGAYVEKANAGKGGVGYEKMIITSNLLQNIDENKIIPIVRQNGTTSIPTFLKTKLYLNFSENGSFEYSYDELVRTIHDSPLLKKPKVGNNPFTKPSELVEPKTNDGVLELMAVVAIIFEQSTYNTVNYATAMRESKVSRIFFDIHIVEAKKLGYIRLTTNGNIILTDLGKMYAIENRLTKF